MLDMAMRSTACQSLLEMPMINSEIANIMHTKRLIAPATDYKSANKFTYGGAAAVQVLTTVDGKYRKKHNYGMPHSNQQTVSVVRRNARERNRVKQVNNGFANLRQHIPPKVINSMMNGNRGVNKKLSKVDTLRLAVEYIKSLQQLLEESEKCGGANKAAISSRLQKAQDMSAMANALTMGMGRVPPHSPVSPTSSFTSDASSFICKPHHLKREPYDNSYEYSSSPSSSPYSPVETTFNNHPYTTESASSFKREGYEDYDPINPEDEELLDTITWWQEQQ